jgi:hypothetical protein
VLYTKLMVDVVAIAVAVAGVHVQQIDVLLVSNNHRKQQRIVVPLHTVAGLAAVTMRPMNSM